jgi:hypothetical protein
MASDAAVCRRSCGVIDGSVPTAYPPRTAHTASKQFADATGKGLRHDLDAVGGIAV